MAGARFVCGALVVTAIGGSAPERPDLVESAVSVSQHASSVTVTDAVRNRGLAAAGASTTGYFLSHVEIGSRRVGPLPMRRASRQTRTFVIPPSVMPGSWRLKACADVKSRVRESNERNNCRAAPQLVEVGDVTPPKFAGLRRATTCIPGPSGGPVRNSPYGLAWSPADDDITPESQIVYEIYAATTSGSEDFGNATYVTEPGATTFVTPPLPDNVGHYFIVRARDRAGNRDQNKVERPGENLCVLPTP
jgi:CARDB